MGLIYLSPPPPPPPQSPVMATRIHHQGYEYKIQYVSAIQRGGGGGGGRERERERGAIVRVGCPLHFLPHDTIESGLIWPLLGYSTVVIHLHEAGISEGLYHQEHLEGKCYVVNACVSSS